MKRLIECLLLLCLLSACKERSIIQPDDLSTVKVEVSGEIKQQPLSEISDYSLLFLPTADSLVIGEINRIRSAGDYVYLSDNSTIYKFTRSGDFVARISKHGAGNGEYLNITDFQIDGMGNVWILSRTMQALLLYSWDNSLLRKISIDGLWAQSFALMGNEMLLYTGNEPNDKGKQLHLLDIEKSKVVDAFKDIDPHQSKYLFVKGLNYFKKESEKECSFIQLFDDTVYHFTGDSLSSYLSFNWDNHNVPESFFEEKHEDIMDFFQKFHAKGIYAYGLNMFIETVDSYWVSYYYQKKCYCAIIPKNGSDQYVFSGFYLDKHENFPVDLENVSLFTQDDGTLIAPIEVAEMKDFLLSSGKVCEDVNNLSDDSNPALLFISTGKYQK